MPRIIDPRIIHNYTPVLRAAPVPGIESATEAPIGCFKFSRKLVPYLLGLLEIYRWDDKLEGTETEVKTALGVFQELMLILMTGDDCGMIDELRILDCVLQYRDGDTWYNVGDLRDCASIIEFVNVNLAPPGSSASGNYDPVNKVLTITIPRAADGQDGQDGLDGDRIDSVVTNTLAPGAVATASYNRVTRTLTLGIPRGADGEDGDPIDDVLVIMVSPTSPAEGEYDDTINRLTLRIPRAEPGDRIEDVTVSMLPPGSDPEGSYDPVTDTLDLKIPRAEDGDLIDSVIAETLPPGSNATVSYDRIDNRLTFGIPRGESSVFLGTLPVATGGTLSERLCGAAQSMTDWLVSRLNLMINQSELSTNAVQGIIDLIPGSDQLIITKISDILFLLNSISIDQLKVEMTPEWRANIVCRMQGLILNFPDGELTELGLQAIRANKGTFLGGNYAQYMLWEVSEALPFTTHLRYWNIGTYNPSTFCDLYCDGTTPPPAEETPDPADIVTNPLGIQIIGSRFEPLAKPLTPNVLDCEMGNWRNFTSVGNPASWSYSINHPTGFLMSHNASSSGQKVYGFVKNLPMSGLQPTELIAQTQVSLSAISNSSGAYMAGLLIATGTTDEDAWLMFGIRRQANHVAQLAVCGAKRFADTTLFINNNIAALPDIGTAWLQMRTNTTTDTALSVAVNHSLDGLSWYFEGDDGVNNTTPLRTDANSIIRNFRVAGWGVLLTGSYSRTKISFHHWRYIPVSSRPADEFSVPVLIGGRKVNIYS